MIGQKIKKSLKKIIKKQGGFDKDESNKRTFKVIELNGKVVDFGNFTIKRHQVNLVLVQ